MAGVRYDIGEASLRDQIVGGGGSLQRPERSSPCPPTPTWGLVYLSRGHAYLLSLVTEPLWWALSSTCHVPDQNFEDTTQSNNEKKNIPACVKSQELQRIEETPSGLSRALSYLEKPHFASWDGTNSPELGYWWFLQGPSKWWASLPRLSDSAFPVSAV